MHYYFKTSPGEELLAVGKKLRGYVTKGNGVAPDKFIGMFFGGQPITAKEFDVLTALRMENTGKVRGVFDVNFDKCEFSAVQIMDGWQTCREIRKESKVPIIMLTARSEERDELQGFELGVDEYISKPFSPKILVARVTAILRRTNALASDDLLHADGIEIDKAAHMVKIDGKPIELSYKEFELLTYFVENQGIALSREKILNNVWNYDYFGDARTIDTHVKKLRSKLGDKGDYIKTIWGMGYKFEVQS